MNMNMLIIELKNETFTKADLDLMGQEPDKPHVFSKSFKKIRYWSI